MHVALSRAKEFRLPLSTFDWETLQPWASRSSPGNYEKKRSGAAALLFYCQVPKIGQIASGGSHTPFHDYHINPEWITDLLQSEKVTLAVAKDLYIKGGKNLRHHLGNLATLQYELNRERVARRVRLVEAACAAQLGKFKTLPDVTDTWLPQFQSIRARYAFLVLDGPSRTGKTCFAKSITGNHTEVLELNCAGGGAEPDLRNFDPALHKAILYDEASPAMVLSQRRLFQSPPCMVDLGCSTTNCHKYQVFVSGVMMMICSNTWSEQLNDLEHEGDVEWLQSNSVHVHVHGPLWEADAA